MPILRADTGKEPGQREQSKRGYLFQRLKPKVVKYGALYYNCVNFTCRQHIQNFLSFKAIHIHRSPGWEVR